MPSRSTTSSTKILLNFKVSTRTLLLWKEEIWVRLTKRKYFEERNQLSCLIHKNRRSSLAQWKNLILRSVREEVATSICAKGMRFRELKYRDSDKEIAALHCVSLPMTVSSTLPHQLLAWHQGLGSRCRLGVQ